VQKALEDNQRAANNLLNAVKAAGQSKALPVLLAELEQVQGEIESLNQQLKEIEQEKPLIPNIDPDAIIAKVQHLEELITGTTEAANREKKVAVAMFIRQLQFNPETNELCIWFWPDPTSPGGPKALIPIKAKQKKKDAPSSFMRTDGAGNRNRPVIIKLELSKRSRPRKTGLI
jgi:hypothetical protein